MFNISTKSALFALAALTLSSLDATAFKHGLEAQAKTEAKTEALAKTEAMAKTGAKTEVKTEATTTVKESLKAQQQQRARDK